VAAEADNQRRIGRNIQIAREQAGLSQEDAAAEAGIHPTTLSMIETGSREPRVPTARRALGYVLYLDFETVPGGDGLEPADERLNLVERARHRPS
jgi:transcriptional regulator with XRE-family HTH domain